jgi:hypothetical protein
VPEDDERRLARERLISSMQERRGKPSGRARYVEIRGQIPLFPEARSEKVWTKTSVLSGGYQEICNSESEIKTAFRPWESFLA